MKKTKTLQGGRKSKGGADSNSPYSSVNSSVSSNGSNGSRNGYSAENIAPSSEIRTIERIKSITLPDTSVSSTTKKAGTETLTNSAEKTTPTKLHKRSDNEHQIYTSPESEISPSSRTLYNEQQELRERVDQYLKDAFENRLASMMNLRMQMEELANAHKQEEDLYVQTIRDILKRNTFENEKRREIEINLKDKISDMENRLRSEFFEKQKTFEEFQTFKEKGTSIIYRLRDSLKKITEKYKEEKQKNMILKKQLKECEDAWEEESVKREKYERILADKQSIGEALLQEKYQRLKEQNSTLRDEIAYLKSTQGNVKLTEQHSQSVMKETERVLESKLREFQRLLEEEESLIEDLKKKVSMKNQENSELRKELERLKFERGLNMDINDVSAVEIPKEYLDVYTEIKGLLDPEDHVNLQTDANPKDKIKSQNRFIKLLLAKLKSEENDRIKSSEQNVKIIMEQEKTISFLDKKLRELENIIIDQREEAQREHEKAQRIMRGQGIMEEEVDEHNKLKELEKKLDDITQDLNSSIQSIQSTELEIRPTIAETTTEKEIILDQVNEQDLPTENNAQPKDDPNELIAEGQEVDDNN
ncbi:hypothetical protein C9374_007743 [Naegleria lovaniensis]|uniref:Uncharacterized protein n=1 Tax=Naegleria lovaniensis TaxID=51637 RepID=A0AA88KH14_NAELO|nr:uncharacterized protein C9374_007743 [Naegleria lovaniensis]KAG2379105.1 hypothetical protein C9374_007743 [Naegleria lovaniensis]